MVCLAGRVDDRRCSAVGSTAIGPNTQRAPIPSPARRYISFSGLLDSRLGQEAALRITIQTLSSAITMSAHRINGFQMRQLTTLHAASAFRSPSGSLVCSQNRIRRVARRCVTVNCCRIPVLHGFGQAVPSESLWVRDRGTARQLPFEMTFGRMWTAVRSVRLPSGTA